MFHETRPATLDPATPAADEAGGVGGIRDAAGVCSRDTGSCGSSRSPTAPGTATLDPAASDRLIRRRDQVLTFVWPWG